MKGKCKHGEFILTEGCPQCIEEGVVERRAAGIRPEQDEMEDGLNSEGLTLATEKSLTLTEPRSDGQIMAFYTEAVSLRQYAEVRIIATNDDLKPATDDLVIIAKVKKGMEEKRKEYLAPFQSHIKEINEVYKTLMEPIEQADKITGDKILAFRAEQKRKRREAEAIEAEKLALARREAALKGGEITVDLTPVEKPEVVPDRVRTDMGSSGLKDHWKLVEVTNFALLPDEYKIADIVKLGKVIRAGLHIIPGCKIENEPGLVVNIKKEG